MEKVLFSEETHFEVRGHRSRFVRRSKGEPIKDGHIEQKSKQFHKKMLWDSFSANGLSRLKVHMLLTMEEFYPDEDMFKKNNATCHTSKKMQFFFKMGM